MQSQVPPSVAACTLSYASVCWSGKSPLLARHGVIILWHLLWDLHTVFAVLLPCCWLICRLATVFNFAFLLDSAHFQSRSQQCKTLLSISTEYEQEFIFVEETKLSITNSLLETKWSQIFKKLIFNFSMWISLTYWTTVQLSWNVYRHVISSIYWCMELHHVLVLNALKFCCL